MIHSPAFDVHFILHGMATITRMISYIILRGLLILSVDGSPTGHTENVLPKESVHEI